VGVLAAHRDHHGPPSWFVGDARDGGDRLGSLGFAWERRGRGEVEGRERELGGGRVKGEEEKPSA